MNIMGVKAVNLDKILGTVRNRVRRIGIELEGGWSRLPAGTKPIHDGSVVFDYAVALQLKGAGELPSPPLNMESWPTWVETFYPQFTNPTCGMHIHLSFNTAMTYQRLMDATYPATVMAYVTTWAKDEKLGKDHPIWPRVRGESEYCQPAFWADAQALMSAKDHDRRRHGNRYTVVNYCYGRHSTIECRLLPMMETAAQAIRAIRCVIDTTNAYLVTTGAKEKKVKTSHVVTEEMLREERKIYI